MTLIRLQKAGGKEFLLPNRNKMCIKKALVQASTKLLILLLCGKIKKKIIYLPLGEKGIQKNKFRVFMLKEIFKNYLNVCKLKEDYENKLRATR